MLNLVKKIKNTKNQLDFAMAFFSLVGHPTDIMRVHKLREQVDKNVKATEILPILLQNPALRQMVDEHYLAPAYKIAELANYAPGTLGYAYYRHITDNRFDKVFYPDKPVGDDFSYINKRLNETHDILHVVTGYSASLEDEMGLQGFYGTQLLSFFQVMLVGAAALHAALLNQSLIKPMMQAVEVGWGMGKAAKPILNVRWEEMWARPLDDIRREYNIKPYKSLYDFGERHLKSVL